MKQKGLTKKRVSIWAGLGGGIVLLILGSSGWYLYLTKTRQNLLNSDHPLQNLMGTSLDKRKSSILIEKSKYRVTLYYDGKPLKSYPVVFGDPIGDKLQAGDRKTPEGSFHLRDIYPHPTLSKFLWVDYPTRDSWEKHNQAIAAGKLHRNAAIGGEIGIHGGAFQTDLIVDLQYNWTAGCIALKNRDVDELYQVVQAGTQVEIVP